MPNQQPNLEGRFNQAPILPQKPKLNVKYVLIVGILAVLIGGGILGYQYWWLPRQETKLPEISIQNPTANWQTYRNEEYNYEIKYPSGWYKAEKITDDIVNSVGFSATEADFAYSKSSANIKITALSSTGLTVSPDLDTWFYVTSHPSEYGMPSSPSPPVFDKELTVGGVRAIQANRSDIGTAGIISAYLVNKDIRYTIELQLPDVGQSAEDQKLINNSKDLFNKMLSTFKFIK